MKHADIMIYLFTILCYCIGLYLLWQDPDDAFYKFLFHNLTAIPVGLFCYKYMRGKRLQLAGRDKIVNILLIGTVVILGLSIQLLTLVDFPREHGVWYNMIFALFAMSTILLIIWSQKKKNPPKKHSRDEP